MSSQTVLYSGLLYVINVTSNLANIGHNESVDQSIYIREYKYINTVHSCTCTMRYLGGVPGAAVNFDTTEYYCSCFEASENKMYKMYVSDKRFSDTL